MKQHILLLIVLVVPAILLLSLFTLEGHEQVIVTRFGKPMRSVTRSGSHMKLPGFLERVNRFDQRIDLFETEPTQLLLGDKKPIIISCFVAWRISDPLLFFQSLGDARNAALKLNDMVTSRLSIVLSGYRDDQIINTDPSLICLEKIQQRVMEATNKSAETKYGVSIVEVGIQRLAYPSVVIKEVYDRMKSERKKEADKITAEGKEAANKIMVEADKKAREIRAEGEKKALILKGEGDRCAMEIYAGAYGRDEVFFDFLRSLETYSKVMREDTTLILSTDSELFRYLQLNDRNGSIRSGRQGLFPAEQEPQQQAGLDFAGKGEAP